MNSKLNLSPLIYVCAAVFLLTILDVGRNLALSQEKKVVIRGSGLPVPRFVSLKSDEANLRTGPGREYPVIWQYRKKGVPLLVEAEFGVWRKVVDHDATSGWMHGSLLSLHRTALVRKNMAEIRENSDETSRMIALAENNAMLELVSCPKLWCKVSNKDIKGWIKREEIWGMLSNEVLD